MQLTIKEQSDVLPQDLQSNELIIRKNIRKAGEAIFEIGKHLKHVKENVIESGKWTEWLKGMDIEPRQAQRFIQVYMELSDHASALSGQSLTKLLTLAQISSVVEDIGEVIEHIHTLPNGKTKTIDEMTSRELEQLKRQLADKDTELEQAKRSEEIALEKLERTEIELGAAKDILQDYELSEPEIEIVTEYIEVDGSSPEILARLKAYEERFGPIENYRDRVHATNTASITTSIIMFNKEIRDFLKRHIYLAQYQGTIPFIDKITQREWEEAKAALREAADILAPRQVNETEIIDAVIVEN